VPVACRCLSCLFNQDRLQDIGKKAGQDRVKIVPSSSMAAYDPNQKSGASALHNMRYRKTCIALNRCAAGSARDRLTPVIVEVQISSTAAVQQHNGAEGARTPQSSLKDGRIRVRLKRRR
jgi:hypothetical protein